MEFRSKTEELFHFLLWTAETLARPSLRQSLLGFEGWLYGNGCYHRLRRLAHGPLVERDAGPRGRSIYRLSAKGRRRALGGRDPLECWDRPWDGRWRVIIFDVPLEESSVRDRIRRQLRSLGYGCRQQSVWVTPGLAPGSDGPSKWTAYSPRHLVVLESRVTGTSSDVDFARAAWDFDAINQRYLDYMGWLEQFPSVMNWEDDDRVRLRDWLRREHDLWVRVMEVDPLLPRSLHPPGYLGCSAWSAREGLRLGVGQRWEGNVLPVWPEAAI